MHEEIGNEEVARGLLGAIIIFALILIDKYLFDSFFINFFVYLIFGER